MKKVLSDQEIAFIKARYLEGYGYRELAEMFGVKMSYISEIVKNDRAKRHEEIPVPNERIKNNPHSVEATIWIKKQRRQRYTYESIAESLGVGVNDINGKSGYYIEKLPKLVKPEIAEPTYSRAVDADGRRFNALTQKQYEWAVKKKKQGFSFPKIAEALDVDPTTLQKHMTGIKPERSKIEGIYDYSIASLSKIDSLIDEGYPVSVIAEETGLNKKTLLKIFNGVRERKLVYDGD